MRHMFGEYLLSTRHCTGPWDKRREQDRHRPYPVMLEGSAIQLLEVETRGNCQKHRRAISPDGGPHRGCLREGGPTKMEGKNGKYMEGQGQVPRDGGAHGACGQVAAEDGLSQQRSGVEFWGDRSEG